MPRISEVMFLCEKYYSKKKLAHAMRVAAYALDRAERDDRVDSKEAFIVGLCHDLIEDTSCPQDQLKALIGADMFTAVCILTKDNNLSYHDYILDIVYSKNDLAMLVKSADMKDHITQVDTLTDKLKEKYLPELHYFL